LKLTFGQSARDADAFQSSFTNHAVKEIFAVDVTFDVMETVVHDGQTGLAQV